MLDLLVETEARFTVTTRGDEEVTLLRSSEVGLWLSSFFARASVLDFRS